MKKIALTLILFASLFSSNVYSNTNEISNEKVFDNPKKEVTTVEAKKNKEHAEMNIKVNKFNIQEIQGYDIGNGKTQYFILKDTENNNILNKLKNTSDYMIFETKEDLSKFLNTNRKNRSLIKKVNFEILENNEQTMLTVDSNKEVYIAKLDITPKIFKGLINQKNNIWGESSVNITDDFIVQLDNNEKDLLGEIKIDRRRWYLKHYDIALDNQNSIIFQKNEDQYFSKNIEFNALPYAAIILKPDRNYRFKFQNIKTIRNQNVSSFEETGNPNWEYTYGYSKNAPWIRADILTRVTGGGYTNGYYGYFEKARPGIKYNIKQKENENISFSGILKVKANLICHYQKAEPTWNHKYKITFNSKIANTIPESLVYDYTLDPTVLNIEQNIDSSEKSRLSLRNKTSPEIAFLINSNNLTYGKEIDLTDNAKNKFKFGYTQQNNEFAKPYIKILDFFDDTSFSFKVSQKVMIEGQDKTLENAKNGYKTDITLNLKYPESGVRILDITELKKGDSETFNLNGRNIQGEPISFSDCTVIKIGKVGDSSSFNNTTYQDSNLSINYDKATNILTVQKLPQGQEEGIDIFIKGYDNNNMLKKIQKIRLSNLNYRGEELKYSAVVDPRYINVISKTTNKKINYAGQIDESNKNYDYSNFFKVENSVNLNKTRIVKDILEINGKTTFLTNVDTFEYEKYKFKSNVNINNFLKTAYLDDHTLAFSDSVRLDVLLNDQKRHYFDLTLRRGENILDNITGSGVLDTTNAIIEQELIFSQGTNVSDIVALTPVEGQQIKIKNSGDFINPYHSEDKRKVIANKIKVNGKMSPNLNYSDEYFNFSIDQSTGYLKVTKKTDAIIMNTLYKIEYFYNDYKLGQYDLTIINKNPNIEVTGIDSFDFGVLLPGSSQTLNGQFTIKSLNTLVKLEIPNSSEMVKIDSPDSKIPLTIRSTQQKEGNNIKGSMQVTADVPREATAGTYNGEVILTITIE